MTIIAAVKTVPYVSFRGTRISLPVLLHFIHGFDAHDSINCYLQSYRCTHTCINAHILSTTDTEKSMIINL